MDNHLIDGAYLILWSGLFTALCVACVPLQDSAPERGDLFAPLQNGDLAEFEYRLAIDAHAGRQDGWTSLGRAYVDLATCREIEAAPKEVRSDPIIHLLYDLVRLEDRRRIRLVQQSIEAGGGAWHRGTIHTKFTSKTYFDREPDEIDDNLIRWPPRGDEKWADEWPAPEAVAFECGDLAERPAPTSLPPGWNFLERDTATRQLVDEWERTSVVVDHLESLGEDSPLVDEVRPKLGAHRADLALLIADRDDTTEDAGQLVDELLRSALDELVSLGVEHFPLRSAWLASKVDEPEIAIEALEHLVGDDDELLDAAARYLIVETAWRQGWWERAAEAGNPLLEGPPSLRSGHAYFAATANRYAGREDLFLGIARQALRDRRRDENDPFLGALYREVLRALADYDVDERTEELLEELGPRNRLDQRKLEFAEISLDMGRPEVAREMIEPLLDRTADARQLPRLYAVRALVAFMVDDRNTFDEYVRLLADRPAELRQVIPRGRRAAFFAHQDAALARVLRATLPLMAEWGDGQSARAMRRQWLEAIVEHTQRFLRWAPESVVSQDLTDLYHLAGRLLEDHPRGYAERVGSEQPSASPLVLGTIDIPPAPPLEDAPRPRLRWPQVYSLLLIPVGGIPPADFVEAPDDLDETEETS